MRFSRAEAAMIGDQMLRPSVTWPRHRPNWQKWISTETPASRCCPGCRPSADSAGHVRVRWAAPVLRRGRAVLPSRHR
jgi:hypothetical protein